MNMVERTIPTASIETLLKKAGTQRLGEDAKEALKTFINKRAAHYTKKANKMAMHAGRKTIRKEDIELARETHILK